MLAWIYWNPQREIFTIPYFDRPIVWYGLLFAIGFFLGYLVFLSVAKKFFSEDPFFVYSEIKDWARFMITLKKKHEDPTLHRFLSCLPEPLKEKILRWDLRKEIDMSIRKGLLFGLNYYIEQGEDQKKARLQLEALFEESLETLKEKVRFIAEKLFLYVLIGTVVGARLGHVLFYENILSYLQDPFRVFKTWEGGLASHGGVVGILIMLLIFLRKYRFSYPQISFARLLDFMMIAAPLTGFFIRIGNFVNQEVLGKASLLPFAIIFGQPADGSESVPRHPAQLYEAIFYLGLFFLLFYLKGKKTWLFSPGKLSGLGFMLMFGFRFLVEFVKEEQSVYHFLGLNMGQWLSLPLIIFGCLLFFSEVLTARIKRSILFTQKI